VGDVGGSNARWALVDEEGRLTRLRWEKCSRYSSLEEALRDYLQPLEESARPRQAALAVACPVLGDRVELTNQAWSFSIRDLEQRMGLSRLLVFNDFEALAMALPVLEEADCEVVKTGEGEAGYPLALLGPGTGLGVGALIPNAGAWLPVSSEGGHQDLAPLNDREWEILCILRGRHGHVSAERVLSGPGLADLYAAICRLEGTVPDRSTPGEIVDGARQGEDAAAREAVGVFSAWLGAVAGDLALVFGARGGVYLGGGMVPKMTETFDRHAFGERFVAKGRFRSYLEGIPVRLIRLDVASLKGAARALEEEWIES
jgi:glucokinase